MAQSEQYNYFKVFSCFKYLVYWFKKNTPKKQYENWKDPGIDDFSGSKHLHHKVEPLLLFDLFKNVSTKKIVYPK